MLSVAIRVSGMLLLSGGMAEGQVITAGAVSGCYATAEEAVSHSGKQQLAARPATGYRVQGTRWDPVLGRRWATVASCDHPERPIVLMAATASAAAAAGEAVTPVARASAQAKQASIRPMVSVGEPVQMLFQDDRMRMELAAVSEGNGNVGDMVRVKVTRYGPEGQGVEQHLMGIVCGSRKLELRRPAGAFQP